MLRRKDDVVRPPTAVVGLDLSLSSTGVVVLPPGWSPTEPWRVAARTFATGPTAMHAARLDRIARSVVDFVLTAASGERLVEVFVEDYAYDRARFTPRTVVQLAELGGATKVAVRSAFGVEARPVTEGQWRKLLLGFARRKGFSDKELKALSHDELRRRGARFGSGDEADAFGVCNAGRAELGLPFLTFATQKELDEKGRTS